MFTDCEKITIYVLFLAILLVCGALIGLMVYQERLQPVYASEGIISDFCPKDASGCV